MGIGCVKTQEMSPAGIFLSMVKSNGNVLKAVGDI